MDNEKILDISWQTIMKFGIAILIFYLLYLMRDILVLIIFALIFSILFNPAIDFISRFKIPRVASVVIVYLGIFGIFGFLIYSIIPIFIYEIDQFTQLFPQYFDKMTPALQSLGIGALQNFESFTSMIEGEMVKASSSILSALGTIFGGIFSAGTVFSIAVFLSLEEKGIEKTLSLLFPKKYEAVVLNIWDKCQKKVAGWFGSRVLACFLVGLMTFLACKILAVKYAISFGLLAAVANIIPIIGPVLAGVVMVLFTLLTSWTKAVFLLIIFILIQQIEGNLITPVLTKKFIGMPPVVVIIALIVGGKLWGLMGALLAMPLFGILFEFIKEFLKKKREERAVVL
jgi:predicted PurR-regulated permease PerM